MDSDTGGIWDCAVSVLLTWVAQQESKLLIWLRLSARLVNRDKDLNKDLIATTDAHHRPVRVLTRTKTREGFTS